MRKVQNGAAVVLIGLLAALLTVPFLAGCASAPQLSSTWSAPGGARPLRNLLVFGIAANANVRRAFENNFVAALKRRGVTARSGHSLLPTGGLADAKAVGRALAQSGADGVIVTHLVGARSETVVVPPGSYTNPRLYASLIPYYQRVYGYVTEPGYYANFPGLQLETNLYDAARQRLVWSARSQTMDPAAEKPTIKEVIATVVDGMAAAGFLPK